MKKRSIFIMGFLIFLISMGLSSADLRNTTLNPSNFTGDFDLYMVKQITSNKPTITNQPSSWQRCGEIMENTELKNNLYATGSCVTIDSPNIVLDCDGHSINFGTLDSFSVGIILGTEANNVTVKNCKINGLSNNKHTRYGIYQDAVSSPNNQNFIYNNQIKVTSEHKARAIQISGGNAMLIKNNTIYAMANRTYGIRFEYLNQNQIVDGNNISGGIAHNGAFYTLIETSKGPTGFITHNNTIKNNLLHCYPCERWDSTSFDPEASTAVYLADDYNTIFLNNTVVTNNATAVSMNRGGNIDLINNRLINQSGWGYGVADFNCDTDLIKNEIINYSVPYIEFPQYC
jgi:hypothetical protein